MPRFTVLFPLVAALAFALSIIMVLSEGTLQPTAEHAAPENSTADEASTVQQHIGSFTMNGPFAVQQYIAELEPGTASPVQVKSGPEMILVLEGELTKYRDVTTTTLRHEYIHWSLMGELERQLEASAEKQVYKAGESFMVPAGEHFRIGNEGSVKAVFVITSLLPEAITFMALAE